MQKRVLQLPSKEPSAVHRWLKAQRTHAAKPLRLATWLGTLGGMLAIAQAFLVAYLVDAAVFGGKSFAELKLWLALLLPVLLLRFAAGWGAEQQAFAAAQTIKSAVRRQLVAHLRTLGPVQLADTPSGSITSSVIDGVEGLEGYYARYVPAAALAGMVPLLLLLAVLPADGLSALVLLVTAPLIPVFMILIGKGAERANQRQWRELARMGGHFLDVLQGLTTLKVLNAAGKERRRIREVSEAFRRSTMGVLRIAFLSSAVLEFFAAISIAIIAVLIGFRLLDGEMAFFYGLFVLLLAPEFFLPLRNLGTHNHARMEAVGAAEHIVQLLSLNSDTRSKGELVTTTVAGDIAFDEVHFDYGNGRRALNGLSFSVDTQTHTALVGRSGSGKSTVANLLLRFAAIQSGEITIDGHPLQSFDDETWHRQLAWIPQKPRLFAGSVADNIRLGNTDASDEAMRDAAARAQALMFIEQLPQGFATRIGDGGRQLSGGQAQRLAIARALLRDCPLVILDEPTAHLDAASEQAVHQALNALSKGRTVITIAHRLQTLRQADRIIVLDDGRCVESGSYAELANSNGAFAGLLNAGEEALA